jgi:HECT-like Ubiquitin-conjugating enzyme (E2)-binding
MTKWFAEGLPRLGVINLQIQFNPPFNNAVNISTVSGSYEALVLTGETTIRIQLPLLASSTNFARFPTGQSLITCRIPAIASNEPSEPTPPLSADELQLAWSQDATLACGKCDRSILSNNQLKWKDLPSEFWLEFSDYWLCHSGSSHGHHHHDSDTDHVDSIVPKSSVIKPKPRVALLGLTSILLNVADTIGLTVNSPSTLSSNTDLKESISLLNHQGETLIQKSQNKFQIIPLGWIYVSLTRGRVIKVLFGEIVEMTLRTLNRR